MRKSRFSEEQIIGILKEHQARFAGGGVEPRAGDQRRDLLHLAREASLAPSREDHSDPIPIAALRQLPPSSNQLPFRVRQTLLRRATAPRDARSGRKSMATTIDAKPKYDVWAGSRRSAPVRKRAKSGAGPCSSYQIRQVARRNQVTSDIAKSGW